MRSVVDFGPGGDNGRLVFETAEGLAAKPFTFTNGFLYQPVTTLGVTNGGRVSYAFNLTNAGAYVNSILTTIVRLNQTLGCIWLDLLKRFACVSHFLSVTLALDRTRKFLKLIFMS
jgi:hypothetical protein